MEPLQYFIATLVCFYYYNVKVKKLFLEGNWSDEGYNVIHIGSNSASSVCHLLNVDGRVWAAYRNCVVIINSETLKVEVSL